MAAPRNQLVERTGGWGASFLWSCSLHLALVTGLIGWTIYNRNFQMGDPNSQAGGGPVAVTAVETIPIFQPPAPERKVANRDTENEVSETKQKKAEPRDDEGVALFKKKKKETRKTDVRAMLDRRLPDERPVDRLTTDLGTKARSEMYRMNVSGMGNLGLGNNNPFGEGFGWYATLLQQKLAGKWVRDGLSARGRTIVAFTIFRNGTVAGGKVVQSSGNPAADRAALGAVEAINPFNPLPDKFPRSAANVEMTFELTQ